MMAISQISACVLLLSALVTLVRARPCVSCPQSKATEHPRVLGSLVLHYRDKTSYKIDYDSSSVDCMVNKLPNKRIAKVVVNSAHFVLYSRNYWRGEMDRVGSDGSQEIPGEEIYPTKVRSVKQKGCKRQG